MVIPYVIRVPSTLANRIRALVARDSQESLSSICFKALRLRLAAAQGGNPMKGMDPPCGKGSTLINIEIPLEIVEGCRKLAKEEGVAAAVILAQGVDLVVVAHGLVEPQRGKSRLRPGRRVANPTEDEMPIVILDDEIAA